MQEYFDIKEELLKCFRIFPSDYRPSLKIMLGVFGLKILGQHHRGIDDCKSISQIVKTLLSYGMCNMTLELMSTKLTIF